MKRLYLLLLMLILIYCHVIGQKINYTIIGVNNGQSSKLDSILFENLTNQTELLFNDLPDQDSYSIDLISENNEPTGLIVSNFNDQFKIIKNIPGEIIISPRNRHLKNIQITMYDLSGRLLYNRNIDEFKSNILVTVPNPSMYVLTLTSQYGNNSFKVLGSNNITAFNIIPIALDSRTLGIKLAGTKSTSSYLDDIINFQIGDSIRVSAYLDGYYTRPKKFIIKETENLIYVFQRSLTDSIGISDTYFDLEDNIQLNNYDTTSGDIEFEIPDVTTNIQEGDIVTIDLDTTGLIQRVTKIQKLNDKNVIQSEPAYMNDLFVNKSFKLNTKLIEPKSKLKSTASKNEISEALTDAQGYIHPVKIIYQDKHGNKIVKNSLLRNSQDEGRMNIIDFHKDISKINIFGKQNDNIHFYIDDGYISLLADAVVEFDFKHGELTEETKVRRGDLKYFTFYLDSKSDVKSKLALDISESVAIKDKKLLSSVIDKRTAFFIVPPDIPVWITFDVDIYGNFQLNTDASINASCGFESHDTLQVGGTYSKETGDIEPFKKVTHADFNYPLDLNGELDVYTRLELFPRVEMKFYSFFGPYAEIVPYISGTYLGKMQNQTTPIGKENFIAWNSNIDYGLEFRVGTKLSFLFDIINYESGPKTIGSGYNKTLWASPINIELLAELPSEVDENTELQIEIKVTDLLGQSVPLCPVYINGDGVFSNYIALTEWDGTINFQWKPNNLGSNSFTAQIYDSDKNTIDVISRTIRVKNVGIKPDAEFKVSQTNIKVGESIQFTDLSTNKPTNWSWDFGDGGTSTLQDPEYAYTSSGIYTVKLISTNTYGSDTESKLNYITVSNSEDIIIFNPNLDYGTISDIDGNEYRTIEIGEQKWMAQNLATTKYNDGTTIPLITDNSDWANRITPAYSWYNNDKDFYKNIYGALYNWFVVETGKLCPTDWHVPSIDEWSILIDVLGGEFIAGGKLKEVGTTHWNLPNEGATNEGGLTILAGGKRKPDGVFDQMKTMAYIWSSTELSSRQAHPNKFSYGDAEVENNAWDKSNGFSVRCVKTSQEITLPTVTTNSVINIGANSANSGGNITDDGGATVTARGVCWSTSQNPTTSDNHTSDGSGTGSFTSSLTGLSPNTTYYVRAYATNSKGTTYGNQRSFITITENPLITLVNTFGASDTYISGSGWTLGYSSSSGDTSVQGIGFVPATSGTVSTYEIAVFRNTGGNQLNAWLLADDGNSPGDVIEQFSFYVPSGSNDLMIIANSTLNPLLMSGNRYWLVVAPPDLGNELFGWYRNLSIDGILNAQGHSPFGSWNVWANDYAPTLRIMGNSQ